MNTFNSSTQVSRESNSRKASIYFRIFPSIAFLLIMFVGIVPVVADGPVGGIGARPDYRKTTGPSRKNAQSEYWAVWAGLRKSIESLLKSTGTSSVENSLLRQIQTNALFLEDKWNVWFGRNPLVHYDIDDDYLESLRASQRLITKLKKEKDEAKTMEILRAVDLDLQIKADNCRNSSDGLGKEIKVKVHTRAGEKEVGGYEVFYVQKGLFDVKSAHDRFPRQSSPTDQKILSPGGYAMWARKKGFTSEPVTMRIGGRGEKALEVDLVVPAE